MEQQMLLYLPVLLFTTAVLVHLVSGRFARGDELASAVDLAQDFPRQPQ